MSEVISGLIGIGSVVLGFALAGGFRRTLPPYIPPTANTTLPAATELTDRFSEPT